MAPLQLPSGRQAMEETHSGWLYWQSHSFANHPKLVPIGQGWNLDRLIKSPQKSGRTPAVLLTPRQSACPSHALRQRYLHTWLRAVTHSPHTDKNHVIQGHLGVLVVVFLSPVLQVLMISQANHILAPGCALHTNMILMLMLSVRKCMVNCFFILSDSECARQKNRHGTALRSTTWLFLLLPCIWCLDVKIWSGLKKQTVVLRRISWVWYC